MSSNNQPLETFRDGAIKVTIWENHGEKGVWHSVEPSRTYTDSDNNPQSANTYSGDEILKLKRLCDKAYDYIADLR